MKTNYVPAIVMLLAGGVYCLFGILKKVSLMNFTVQLFIILIIFWIVGGIIKIVLDRFMGEIEDKSKKDTEKNEESSEENSEEEKENSTTDSEEKE